MRKNILITGCSSGLGLALVKLYLKKNYKVFAISKNKPKINNKNLTFIKCDLSKVQNIKKTLSKKIKNIKKIQRVYLNAGVLGEINELSKIKTKDIKKAMDINVYANKELLDILKELEVKNIIATSSGASISSSYGWGVYNLCKGSLNMLINIYSKEMENTKLYAIAPGVIKTAMTDIIRYEVDEAKYSSAKLLKAGLIQTPKKAAQRLHKSLKRASSYDSGSFLDVREL